MTSKSRIERLRSIESAAIAGVIYAVLTIVALVIFRRFPDPSLASTDIAAWYNDTANHTSLIVALNLVSMASVAFLWFVAVIRRRMGDREDRFFSTVFLGSALLYLVTFIAGAVAMAAPAVGSAAMDIGVFDRATATINVGTTSAMLLIIGPRLQAVFMLTTSTLILRTRVMPNWLAYLGYATGVLLFLFPIVAHPIGVVFQLWELVVSNTIALTPPQPED